MLDMPKASFSFLAFDENSNAILAHGLTPRAARDWAMEVAPFAAVQVLSVGRFGRTMWNRRFTLLKTQRALSAVGIDVAEPDPQAETDMQPVFTREEVKGESLSILCDA